MPYDIIMCPGEQCPLRARCYRYRAVPQARQDWFGTAPYDATRERCEQFWDIASIVPSEQAIRDRAYMIWMASGCVDGRADEHWRQAHDELWAATSARLTDRT